MPTLNYGVSLTGGGTSINRALTRNADGVAAREIALPAGKAGSLTTRTNDTEGEATLGDGHGIATGNVVDIYWNGGVRYGVTVGTVSSNAVPITDTGAGDNLPTQSTEIVMCKQVEFNAAIDGDELEIIGIEASFANLNLASKLHVDFQDYEDDSIAELDLDSNSPRIWDITGGADNPFTGDPIVKGFASNGSSAQDATLKVLWLQDTTP